MQVWFIDSGLSCKSGSLTVSRTLAVLCRFEDCMLGQRAQNSLGQPAHSVLSQLFRRFIPVAGTIAMYRLQFYISCLSIHTSIPLKL